MSSKRDKTELGEEDFNFNDDDYGFGADFDDGESSGRKPTLKSTLKQIVADEIEAKKQDAETKKRLLKKSLPKDFSYVIDGVDVAGSELGTFIKDQQKEWEKVRGDTKKAIKPIADLLSKFGADGLKAWVEKPGRGSYAAQEQNQEAIDTLQMQSMIGEVFGNGMAEERKVRVKEEKVKQDKEDEQYATETADRDRQFKETARSSMLLTSINDHAAAGRAYRENVTINFQKKSLELQARTLLATQRLLQTMSLMRGEQAEELKGIHKNTGLPEFAKINASELTQQAISQKILAGVTSPFDGKAKTIAKNVTNKMNSKLREYWSGFGELMSNMSSQSDDNPNFYSSTGKDIFGGYLGNKVIEGVEKHITPKIRRELEKRGIAIHGSNLRSIMAQAPDLFNHGVKNGFGEGKMGKFLDTFTKFFDINPITAQRKLLNRDDMELEKAAFMDNRMKLTIVDVIPGWLKKIYGQFHRLVNKGKAAPDLDYDFLTGNFVDSKELTDKTIAGIIDKDAAKNRAINIDAWLDALDPQKDGRVALSKPARDYIRKWVSRRSLSSDSLSPYLLLSDVSDATVAVRGELLHIVPRLLKLPEKVIAEIQDQGITENVMSAFTSKSTKTNDMMNKLADAGERVKSSREAYNKEKLAKAMAIPQMRKALLESGIVLLDQEGDVISVNAKLLERLDMSYARNESKLKRNVLRQGGDGYEFDDKDDLQDVDMDRYSLQAKMNVRTFEDSATSSQRAINRQMELSKNYIFGDTPKVIRTLVAGGETYHNVVADKDYVTINHGSPNETIITSDDNEYATVMTAYRKKTRGFSFGAFSSGAATIGKQYLGGAFTPTKRRGRFAAGGITPSYAKGGPTPNIQPDKAVNVNVHGGEFVVENDATKFNVQVLEAINKIGAPLIKPDKSINSAYYKLFGFKSAGEFSKSMDLKGVKSQTGKLIDEGTEATIEKIFQTIDIRGMNPNDIRSVTDRKLSSTKRLSNVIQLYAKQQKNQAKADPKGYASSLAKMGINKLGKGFDHLLDTDGTGVNVAIKNRLAEIAGGIGSNAASGVKGVVGTGLGSLKAGAKNLQGKSLNRAATMTAVSTVLAEVENPKMYTMPIDLYFSGQGTPFLTREGFKREIYIDKNTASIIKNPSQITGTIILADGSQVVSTAELSTEKIVTRSNKPYKLLGMDEASRRYNSASDVIANRYGILAASDKFQENLQKAKDVRDKYVLDKPVDVYIRSNLNSPVLTAAGFKAKRYVDKETGNILWTHHDITGAVTDTQTNNQLISVEDLEDGLFDSAGVALKISKIKQIRNMAFKRTNEAYQKYASKHVNKVGNYFGGKLAAMGEKAVGMNFDDKPIDVYVAGESRPRIKSFDFKSNQILCNGKIIKSHSGIAGPVTIIGEFGPTVLVSEDELGNLVDAMGEKLQLPLLMSGMGRLKAYTMEAVLPKNTLKTIKDYLKLTPDKRAELTNDTYLKAGIAFDVYIKGEPTKPVLTKAGFNKGKYIDKNSGKVVAIPEHIKGPIMGLDGNEILSDEDIKKGLVDRQGKEVKIGGTGLINDVMGKINIAKRLTAALATEAAKLTDVFIKGEKSPVVKARDFGSGRILRADNQKPVEDYSDLTAGVTDDKGNVVISDEDIAKGLVTKDGKSIKNKMKSRNILGSKLSSLRVGSWQWLRAQKEKITGTKEEKKEKEKGSGWMGKLVKLFMLPLSIIGGGIMKTLTGIGGIFQKSIWWLGKSIITKMAIPAAQGLMGLLGGGGGRGGLLSKLGGRGKLIAAGLTAATAYGGYKYLNKDNQEPQVDEEGNPIEGTPGGGGNSTWDTVKDVGGIAASFAAPTLAWKGAKLLGKGAMHLATKGPGLLKMGGWALKALKLGRMLTPWGLGLTAAVWLGSKAWDMWKDAKNPWNRFRMAQYGFDHNDSGVLERVAKIETLSKDMLTVTSGNVSITGDDKKMDEILTVCGFKDENGKDIESEQQRAQPFMMWFQERFLKIYASYLVTLERITGKAEIGDLQQLNRTQQKELLKGVHFTSAEASPYTIMTSPFDKPNKCSFDYTDVSKLAHKLEATIAKLPEPPEAAVKVADTGLADDKPLSKKDSDTPENKAEIDHLNDAKKDMKKVAETPMSAAEKAVKISQIRQEAIVKTHQATMVKTAEQAGKQTDSIFNDLMSSLGSGLDKMANAAKNALAGTARALGDTSGVFSDPNAGLGTTLYAGAQAIGDAVGSAFGSGGGEVAEGNLIRAAMQAGITNPTEIAMFLAQANVETGGLKRPREKGDDKYLSKYEGRKNLGNVNPGDGLKFRGRGWMQLTGRANYEALSKGLNVDFISNPELLEKEPYASQSALWYWMHHGNMKSKGRAAAQQGDVRTTTKAINGGYTALKEREQKYAEYTKKIGGDVQGYLARIGGGSTSSTPAPTAPGIPANKAPTSNLPATISAPKPAGALSGPAVQSMAGRLGMPSMGATLAGMQAKGVHNTPIAQANVAAGGKKYFIGDSIAFGYGGANKGAVVKARVGAPPKEVYGYVEAALNESAANIKNCVYYLSTGMSNDFSAKPMILKQFALLKAKGIKAFVLGVSFTYPKANPVELNTWLRDNAKAHGHVFMGGFEASGDKVHPKNFSVLPSSGKVAVNGQGVPVTNAPSAVATPEQVNAALKTAAQGMGTVANMGANLKVPAGGGVQPAGVSNGKPGQWDVVKMAQQAARAAMPRSLNKCATYVRQMLQAGDILGQFKKFNGTLASAYMYMDVMPKLGFTAVGNIKTVAPKMGDVAVFPRYASGSSKGGAAHGHICMWTGQKWVSDFVQATVYPHSRYANSGLPHTIFRPNGAVGNGNVSVGAEGMEEGQQAEGGINATMNNISNGGGGAFGGSPGGGMEQAGMGGGQVESLLSDVVILLRRSLSTSNSINDGIKALVNGGGLGKGGRSDSSTDSSTAASEAQAPIVPKFDSQTGKPLDAKGEPINSPTTVQGPTGVIPPKSSQDIRLANAPDPISVSKP